MKHWKVITFAAAIMLGMGCAAEPDVYDSGVEDWEYEQGKGDASAIAVFLDFEFDGELVTSSCFNPRAAIDEQMLYTVGQLNGDKSVSRLDRLEVSNVTKEQTADGCKVTYHARILVAWGKRNQVPENYTFLFPQDVSHAGTKRFMESYEWGCLTWSAHDVTPGIFWYYYRPNSTFCELKDADIVRSVATVTPSTVQTTGKYPEYHKVWEDDAFEVVAIFGKVKDGGDNTDGGVRGYNEFVKSVKDEMARFDPTTPLSEIPNSPGIEMPEVTLEATVAEGRKLKVSVFLVDSVGTANNEFWQRYETLTPSADFIVYNGHSGLGANIKKLARKGVWAPGQYSMVFMNGCDTYAYVDSALADAHAAVNPDDPDGTLYLDVIANAMPSFFRSMPEATMAILEALLDWENPKTYEEIFLGIDPAEVVLVTGEHDNVYHPDGNF